MLGSGAKFPLDHGVDVVSVVFFPVLRAAHAFFEKREVWARCQLAPEVLGGVESHQIGFGWSEVLNRKGGSWDESVGAGEL